MVRSEVDSTIPSTPKAVVRLAGKTGGEYLSVRVVRTEQQPFDTTGNEVILGERYLPVVKQFRLECQLAHHNLVVGGVEQVNQTGSDRGLENLSRQQSQVALTSRISKVARIDHLVERLGVVDVRRPTAVHIAAPTGVRLAIKVEV